MTTSKMKDDEMPLRDRIEAAIERIKTGQAPMRVPVEATDPDVVLADCLAELDAATAREQAADTSADDTLELLNEQAAARAELEGICRALRAHISTLREALKPFAAYIAAREAKPLYGLSSVIHSIHAGTEWEAELTLANCAAARAALAETEDR